MTAQGFTTAELNTLARIEATPAAPESFDPIATLRRVAQLADDLDDVAKDYRHVPSGTHDAGARNAHMAIARRIRAALAADSAQGGGK